jgi:hypothetical protein
LLATGIWLVLWLPPLRAWLEATMFRHMLVQLPLLAGIGWIWGRAWQRSARPRVRRVLAVLGQGNRWGATGVLLAIATMTLWMLPRLLDHARLDPGWDLVKFLTLSLCAGTAAAWSWARCPPIVRGVLHLEIIATLWRLGWVYLATEERLCLSYLLGDQQRTGQGLLLAGAAWGLAVVWAPLFGAAHRRPTCPGQPWIARRPARLHGRGQG